MAKTIPAPASLAPAPISALALPVSVLVLAAIEGGLSKADVDAYLAHYLRTRAQVLP